MNQNFVQWSQPYQYDNGSLSSVGINDDGTVLEVHNGPGDNNGMYYRLGQYTTIPSSDLTSCIDWNPVYPNPNVGDGNRLSADINGHFAVQVYQASDKLLIFQSAPLPAGSDGQLNWNAGQNYTNGEIPAIAVNANNSVIVIHQDSSVFLTTLWYATGSAGGEMGGASQIFQPDGSGISADEQIQVALNDQGTIVVAYTNIDPDGIGRLSLIAGSLQPNGSVTFGSELNTFMAITGGFDIALDNDNNLILLCIAPDPSALLSGVYLGWITGSVNNNSVTLQSGEPLPLNYTIDGPNVTIAMNNSGNLIAETGAGGGPPPLFQYFVGQVYWSADYSHWMGDNLSSFGDVPLNLLALPGSHDSGTYGITENASPDNPSFLGILDPDVGNNWAQSQDLSFLAQLNTGIRYFDLRVCYTFGQGIYFTCHGYYAAPLTDLFADITSFYAQGPSYANEIILLDINHIFTNTSPGATWGGGNYWMPGGPNGEFPALCAFINSNIGSLLLPPSLNSKSLNEIIVSPEYEAGGRIILFFDDTYSLTQNANYWPNVDSDNASYWQTVDSQTGAAPDIPPTINSPWPNVTSLQNLVSSINSTLQNVLMPAWTEWRNGGARPTQFVVLQCIGTEGNSQVEAGLGSGAPHSLQSWEAGICSPSLFWLAAQPTAVAVNVVMVDWLEQTIVTPLCIALNQSKTVRQSNRCSPK